MLDVLVPSPSRCMSREASTNRYVYNTALESVTMWFLIKFEIAIVLFS
jgi:hypothetical protein